VRVLGEWTLPLPAYHLYHPSRRNPSAAVKLFVDALRYKPRQASKTTRTGKQESELWGIDVPLPSEANTIWGSLCMIGG
jgi:hypothetical protein